jgi:putative endonuclease
MALPRRGPFRQRMTDPHDFGRNCERAAASFLETRGWRLLARNYRFGHREIDLIGERAGVVAFFEVKGRRGARYGDPLESITGLKRREIEAVARHWLARHGCPGSVYRFDAIAVLESREGGLEIRHVPDAWRIGQR